MADVVFNPVAGVPFSGGLRMKDLGDGTFAPTSMNVSGFTPVTSLSAVSATGPGVALDNTGVRNNHNLVVNTSAGVSAGTVVLQGSQDGTNWFLFNPTISVSTTSANATFVGTPATLTPVRFLRANVTVGITGGTITALVASA